MTLFHFTSMFQKLEAQGLRKALKQAIIPMCGLKHGLTFPSNKHSTNIHHYHPAPNSPTLQTCLTYLMWPLHISSVQPIHTHTHTTSLPHWHKSFSTLIWLFIKGFFHRLYRRDTALKSAPFLPQYSLLKAIKETSFFFPKKQTASLTLHTPAPALPPPPYSLSCLCY